MTSAQPKPVRIAPARRALLLTAIAMALFAANSLLARVALRGDRIDAGAFTTVRIACGAAVLAVIAHFRREGVRAAVRHGSAWSALALFIYAVTFSFAYLWLTVGTGALVLFAAVQVTMLGIGIGRGERPRRSEWAGLALAFGGFVYLVSPGLTAPSPAGVLLMTVSGVAWGCYSLAARGVRSPVAATAGNFLKATPLAAATLIAVWGAGQARASWPGIGLAAASGGIASGLGYAAWYVALKDLRTAAAAIVQLTVPLLAAAAGAVLLGEAITWRLVAASAAILGGVGMALLAKPLAWRNGASAAATRRH